jgi:hypothetical protein
LQWQRAALVDTGTRLHATRHSIRSTTWQAGVGSGRHVGVGASWGICRWLVRRLTGALSCKTSLIEG